MPAPGRLVLSPMLNPEGRLIGDFTVGCLAGNRAEATGHESFLIFGSGVAEAYHLRWFTEHLPDDGTVALRALGPELCGLSIAGPKARELLDLVSDDGLDRDDFGFLDFRPITVGMQSCLAGRISYTGDLGFELWMPASAQTQVFDRLMAAGADHDLRLFGTHALNSLRLEKNFGAWASEYRPIYTPDEAGLGWTIRTGKDFIGRDAVLAAREAGPRRHLTFFSLADDPEVAAGQEADVIGDEPIWYDDRVVGWVTSGGYAHHSRASVAAGYVEAGVPLAGDGPTRFEIEVFGVRRPAAVLAKPLFDPSGERMRA
jgi:dimethylglycine dehydrogenase